MTFQEPHTRADFFSFCGEESRPAMLIDVFRCRVAGVAKVNFEVYHGLVLYMPSEGVPAECGML